MGHPRGNARKPRLSRDKTVRLWDRQTGEELHVFHDHAGVVSAKFAGDSSLPLR
jgi:WD40 repeat protein